MSLHPLNLVAMRLRLMALLADESVQELEDHEFKGWCKGTVYPAAVDRWLYKVAEDSR